MDFDLNRLPPTCRRCYFLVVKERKSVEDAAKQLNIPVKKVHRFVVRAMQAVKS